MKKVFVSGCYDIIHAGHIQFFEDARALGDHLTVCFANKEVLLLSKGRPASLPDEHKRKIIGSLKGVDTVVSSSDLDPVFDFLGHWKKEKPDILAVTEDDNNVDKKRIVCEKYNVQLVVLPKGSHIEKASTTSILAGLKKLNEVPLRVDFGGGWLDVPALSRPGAFIVNCTITPMVSLENWPYHKGAGLGGSAAYALLKIKNGVKSEIDLGVGWQDPAVINETGLCIWRSGKQPVLETKYNPDWLNGKMMILWTGVIHSTPDIIKNKRDYTLIEKAGMTAAQAVAKKNIKKLAQAIGQSYKAQLAEKMAPLPKIPASLPKPLAYKYLGGGHGSYALYLFKSEKERTTVMKKWKEVELKAIEPYIK